MSLQWVWLREGSLAPGRRPQAPGRRPQSVVWHQEGARNRSGTGKVVRRPGNTVSPRPVCVSRNAPSIPRGHDDETSTSSPEHELCARGGIRSAWGCRCKTGLVSASLDTRSNGRIVGDANGRSQHARLKRRSSRVADNLAERKRRYFSMGSDYQQDHEEHGARVGIDSKTTDRARPMSKKTSRFLPAGSVRRADHGFSAPARRNPGRALPE